jgi:hypothetical protein
MEGQLRIERMYAFVVVDDDGTEGIPSILAPDGMAMPLVGADVRRVDQLRPLAQAMAISIGKPIELVLFSDRMSIDVLSPDTTPEEVL